MNIQDIEREINHTKELVVSTANRVMNLEKQFIELPLNTHKLTYTVKEAAEVSGLKTGTIRQLYNQGVLTGKKTDKNILIHATSLHAHLQVPISINAK